MTQLPPIQPQPIQPQAAPPPIPPMVPPAGWLLQLWMRRLLEDWLRRQAPPAPDNKPVPPPPDPPMAAADVQRWIAEFDTHTAGLMVALRWLGASDPQAATTYAQIASYCNLWGVSYTATAPPTSPNTSLDTATVPGAPTP